MVRSVARRLLAPALLAVVGLGCATRSLPANRPDHGNMTAAVARARATTAADVEPLVVLFEDGEVRGVDPTDGSTRWRRPLRTLGHPAAGDTTIVVPLAGHRLAAIDRASGLVRWEVALPGEALTGVTVGRGLAIVTAVGGPQRSIAGAFALLDGSTRWVRASPDLLGVPAAAGDRAFIPSGRSVVAVDTRGGREVARVRVPLPDQVERVVFRGNTTLAGGHTHWVDLFAGRPARQSIDPSYGAAFPVIRGIDPGFGESEGTGWWLRPSEVGDIPRDAVFVQRRTVIAVRLDPDGRPLRARWVHHRRDGAEIVAVDVGPHRVSIAREDGTIWYLDADDGHGLGRTEATVPNDRSIRGALLLGLDTVPLSSEGARPEARPVVPTLTALLEDPDPRLVPAQRLALDLLWRDPDPEIRSAVADFVHGAIRPAGDGVTKGLRTHARTRLTGHWGPATTAEIRGMAKRLGRSSEYHRGDGGLGRSAAKVVRSGSPRSVERLVAHLSHPATTREDLEIIARTLRRLGHPAALDGVGRFVLRYHADSDICAESTAMLHALEYLIDQVQMDRIDDPDVLRQAQQTLEMVVHDPYTDRALQQRARERLGTVAAR